MQSNSYICYEKLRSHSFTSRSRDFVFLRQAVRFGDRTFLIDRSVEHSTYPPGHRVARGNIVKRVTALVPHLSNKMLTLLVCLLDAEYGGYSS